MRKLDKIEVANMLFKVPLTRKEAYDNKATDFSNVSIKIDRVLIDGVKQLLRFITKIILK